MKKTTSSLLKLLLTLALVITALLPQRAEPRGSAAVTVPASAFSDAAPDDAAVYERALHEPSPENLAAWVGVLEETFSRRYRP